MKHAKVKVCRPGQSFFILANDEGFSEGYDGYFFPSGHRNSHSTGHLSGTAAYFRLRGFMNQAGIYKEDGKPPRVHDLRHTFAVHSLGKMVSEGRDIYCALPTLSTYLGHRGIESTEKYLRLTEESFESVVKGMATYYDNVLPEVSHDKE